MEQNKNKFFCCSDQNILDSSRKNDLLFGKRNTGVFCRSDCDASDYNNRICFENVKEAVEAGYRPCKKCTPIVIIGETPDEIKQIIIELSNNPSIRLKDQDLLLRGIDPNTIRNWFIKYHEISLNNLQRILQTNCVFNNGIKKPIHPEQETQEESPQNLVGIKSFIETFEANKKFPHTINITSFETPLGTMFACATKTGICMLEFTDRKILDYQVKGLVQFFKANIVEGSSIHLNLLQEELSQYFAGKLSKFTVQVHTSGSVFQEQVWKELRQIPYGSTRSYQQIAKSMDHPKAVRAVANANGRNKIAIIIPCHRVIGSDGSLTGYAGGLHRKSSLLELESNTEIK